MNVFRLLPILVAIGTNIQANAECDACIDGHCYITNQIDKGDCNIFHGIAIDRTENKIYYTSYKLKTKFKECALQLNDNSTEVISYDNNYYNYAIDQKVRAVYATPRYKKGVHKYDPITNTTEILLRNIRMRKIYFKDKLYCLTYGGGLYTYEDGVMKRIMALKNYSVNSFIVDKDDDIYFTHQYKKGNIYLLKDGTEEAVLFNEARRFFSIDRDDRVVFVTEQDIATELHRVENNELVLFGVIGTRARTLLFDTENNIVFYDAFRRPNIEADWKYLKRSELRCTFSSNATTTVIHGQEIDIIIDREHLSKETNIKSALQDDNLKNNSGGKDVLFLNVNNSNASYLVTETNNTMDSTDYKNIITRLPLRENDSTVNPIINNNNGTQYSVAINNNSTLTLTITNDTLYSLFEDFIKNMFIYATTITVDRV